MKSVARQASHLRIEFSEERLTAVAGVAFIARLAERVGLPAMLQGLLPKKRKRGVSPVDAALSMIYNLSAGRGALADLDLLGTDKAVMGASGLEGVIDSRRASEYLSRFDAQSLSQLLEIARRASQAIAPQIIGALTQDGYLPVFMDGSAIEVTGNGFEGAKKGYNGELQYWLHTVFIGDVWASGRLNEGATDVALGWQEQLDSDIAPLMHHLPQHARPWLRMDNAYYRGDIVQWARDKGWDYSISVTNDNNKAPILRQVRGDSGHHWRKLNDDENATIVHHKPQGWKHPQAYVVIETRFEGKQALIEERYSVIAVSEPHLPVRELVKRHRAKQGQENALKGPLIEMDLHHPPCKRHTANQAFYAFGQIAQMLLMALKYQALPQEVRAFGVGRIIKWFVSLAGKLTTSGRRLTLWLSKGHGRLDWINHCMSRLGFG